MPSASRGANFAATNASTGRESESQGSLRDEQPSTLGPAERIDFVLANTFDDSKPDSASSPARLDFEAPVSSIESHSSILPEASGLEPEVASTSSESDFDVSSPSTDSESVPPEISSATPSGAASDQDSLDTERGDQMRIERGEGNAALWVPRDERLDFSVHLNLGLLGDPKVGSVTLSSRVSPFRPSALVQRAPQAPAATKEQALLAAVARGSYAVYELEEVINTAYLPQEFPAALLTTTQRGSENRRRELKLGHRDGSYTAQYRSDHHCKICESREHFIEPAWVWQDERHCPGCKRAEHRLWREPRSRTVPEGSLDMLGAVYFARSQIQAGETEFQFSLIDKLELWDVRVRQGKQKLLSVDGGRFDAVELLLDTRVPEGETGRSAKDFSGLFGIKGTLSIWFHRGTGVPVLIRGEMPAGIMDLDVRVELNRWRGTPAEFRALPR